MHTFAAARSIYRITSSFILTSTQLAASCSPFSVWTLLLTLEQRILALQTYGNLYFQTKTTVYVLFHYYNISCFIGKLPLFLEILEDICNAHLCDHKTLHCNNRISLYIPDHKTHMGKGWHILAPKLYKFIISSNFHRAHSLHEILFICTRLSKGIKSFL